MAIKEKSTWLPIATAPMDGETILFAQCQHEHVDLVGRCQWLEESYGLSSTWWSDDFSREVNPTHWIPMPIFAP